MYVMGGSLDILSRTVNGNGNGKDRGGLEVLCQIGKRNGWVVELEGGSLEAHSF